MKIDVNVTANDGMTALSAVPSCINEFELKKEEPSLSPSAKALTTFMLKRTQEVGILLVSIGATSRATARENN